MPSSRRAGPGGATSILVSSSRSPRVLAPERRAQSRLTRSTRASITIELPLGEVHVVRSRSEPTQGSPDLPTSGELPRARTKKAGAASPGSQPPSRRVSWRGPRRRQPREDLVQQRRPGDRLRWSARDIQRLLKAAGSAHARLRRGPALAECPQPTPTVRTT